MGEDGWRHGAPWLTAYGSVAGGSCCPLAAIARSLKQFIKTASEVRDTEVDVFPLLSLHGTALTVIVSGLFTLYIDILCLFYAP